MELGILQFFSISTLITQLVIVLGGVYIFSNLRSKNHTISTLIHSIRTNAYLIGFIGSSMAIIGSLFLSEVLKLQVCNLCWIQRALIYPQVVIFGFAHFKKKENLWLLLIILNIATTLFAGYHYFIQLNGSSSIVCNAFADASSTCHESPFWGLGYITIPVMSLTYAIGIIILLLVRKLK